jgi:hypothetical protein
VAAAQGDLARAAALGQESLALFRELGGKVGIATALHNLGYVALDQGDLARAAALHREALTQLEELGDKAGVALALIGVAHVAAAERRRELAVRLFAASAVLRESIGRAISPASRGRIERRLDEMRGELGTAAFDDAWAAGQAMTWEDAAAEALGELQR